MGKSAIVTGAGAGIGAEICVVLAEAGYRVGVLDVAADGAKATAAGLADAVALPADVTDEASVTAAFDAFGAVPDLVVNNAGIVRFGLLAEHALADFRRVIEINLVGAYIVTREALRRMLPRKSGHIISLTSTNAYGPGPGAGAYPASKAGVLQMMRQVAVEYGDQGIRANSIAPGFIDGGMSKPIYADPKVRARRSSGVPLARLGTPRDVAELVRFLDSDGASYITGQDILVDGGVTWAAIRNLPRE